MAATEVTETALAWVAGAVGSPWARTVRRLAGGTHALTHVVETGDPTRAWVLRRFPPGDGAAAREARVLTALDGLDGRAPRLAAADPEGARTGAPATLVTLLPGRADLAPAAPETAAAALGLALAHAHARPLADLASLPEALPALPRGEAGAAGPAVAAHGARLAGSAHVMTHYDYWSGNVLWEGGALTGIVDWSGGGLAPRGHDVSWCRLDLALLYGAPAADAFLAAYEREARTVTPDLGLWDLSAVARSHTTVESWRANYGQLGRADLDGPALRSRHTAWTSELIGRNRELMVRS